MQFGGGSGYCICAVTLGTSCTNHGPSNLLLLVFDYKCASLLSFIVVWNLSRIFSYAAFYEASVTS